MVTPVDKIYQSEEDILKMDKKVIKDVDEQQMLVSQIEEVGAEIGEPDCKLLNPKSVREILSLRGC